MSQQVEQRVKLEGLDGIVDSDAHLREMPEDLIPYIDDEYEAVRKIMEETPNPLQDIYSITHSMPPYLLSEAEYAERHKEADSFDAKLEEMDEFGIDYGLLNPHVSLTLPTVNNTRFAVALANAYNSWLLDNILDRVGDRFMANMVVAHQIPEKAAEEIDRVGDEEGICGVLIPSTGVVPPLGHTRYDPVYEAAERHGLPVVLHGASTNTSHAFPLARMFNETYAEDHTMIHPFSQMWELISMMFQGVPERYPGLDFVIQESGIAWIPFITWRMDDHYLELPHELPYVEKLPSEYIADQFYFTTQPLEHTARDHSHLAKAIELAGPENIMYSSDLPHSDFDPPSELFDRIAPHFDAKTVRGMMGETAADVFGLDI